MPEELIGTHVRQRQLYDRLWRRPRADALSPDLIRFRVWLRHVRPPVVDIGAGDALFARAFPELGVISVDLSEIGIREAAKRGIAGAAERLPIRGQSVRTVVLSEVLEHVEDPEAVLGEARRIMERDGSLLLSTPVWPIAHAEQLFYWRRIRQRPTLENIALWDPQHERRFDLQSLLSDLRRARFSVEEVVPLFGSASTAGIYVLEPMLGRMLRRPVRLAHRLTAVDRVLRQLDRSSGVAVICRPA